MKYYQDNYGVVWRPIGLLGRFKRFVGLSAAHPLLGGIYVFRGKHPAISRRLYNSQGSHDWAANRTAELCSQHGGPKGKWWTAV